ncbi:unnamed protein product, partial [Phaeothamnion confervicola]
RPGTSNRGFTQRATVSTLSDYFALPIEEAAKSLGVSTTIVKRVCRRLNIKKWPHRKLVSVQRKL